MPTVALFGGAFDPPHCGHLAIARAVLAENLAAQVWFVPAKSPPHKIIATAPVDRLAMTALAIADEPRFVLCACEIENDFLNYTIDTLNFLRTKHAEYNFRLLIGADMALTFDTWRDAETLLSLAPPLIAARPHYEFPQNFGTETPSGISRAGREILRAGIFSAPLLPIASSIIRQSLADIDDCQEIPPTVATYIREHRLYESS